MTSKERVIKAMSNNGEPDMVPVYPGASHLYPCRFSGKDYWDIAITGNIKRDVDFWRNTPAVIDAQINLVKMLGYDYWSTFFLCPSEEDPEVTRELIMEAPEKKQYRYTTHTKKGDLVRVVTYPKHESPWPDECYVKDPKKDYDKILALLTDPWKKQTKLFQENYEKVGNMGAFGFSICTPFDWWAQEMRRSVDVSIFDLIDETETVSKLFEAYSEWALELIKVACEKATPDVIYLQGSSSSMSCINPSVFRDYNLPFVQKAAEIAKKYHKPSYYHSGGLSLRTIEMVADSDLTAIGPCERPPLGDVNLKEIKEKFGRKLALLGNVPTIEGLWQATPEVIKELTIGCIKDAAPGGGFILAAGDQIGYDTPLENVKMMIATAKEFGKYPISID